MFSLEDLKLAIMSFNLDASSLFMVKVPMIPSPYFICDEILCNDAENEAVFSLVIFNSSIINLKFPAVVESFISVCKIPFTLFSH